MKKTGLGLKTQIEAEKKTVINTAAEAKNNDTSRRPRSAARDGKKALIAYFTPDVSKTLARMSIDEDTTMQALIGEGIDLLMENRGKHRFGER
jgi:hypothetical protein